MQANIIIEKNETSERDEVRLNFQVFWVKSNQNCYRRQQFKILFQ